MSASETAFQAGLKVSFQWEASVEVKNRSSRDTGVESTELDPTVLIKRGSLAAAVYSTWKSERKRKLLPVFLFFACFY